MKTKITILLSLKNAAPDGAGHELRLLAIAFSLSRLTLLSAWLNFLR
jgi:hypothetical protein